jgi:hypothetical protein
MAAFVLRIKGEGEFMETIAPVQDPGLESEEARKRKKYGTGQKL